MTPRAAPGALAESLQRALSARLDGEVGPVEMRRLSGGASRETWSIDTMVSGPSGTETLALILQRTRGGKSPTGIPIPTEAALVRAAGEAGVRVPEVVVAAGDECLAGLDDELVGLGDAWMISRRLDGEALPPRLLRDDAYAEARAVMIADCGRALAAIHRIPAQQVPGLEDADRLTRFQAVFDAFGEPHPAFELAIRWLAANRPESTGPAKVVHGDFRTGNLLVDASGLTAVLDWELAHVGDPVEDLGWFCTRSWRFGSPLPAGGFGSREELLAAYQDAGGVPVDLVQLKWWEVMGTLSWGVICMVQCATHRLGMSRSVELAAIGRRVCETELDLLRLLPGPDPEVDPASPVADAGAGAAGEAGRAAVGLHGVPTMAELLEATREWLSADVTDATEGRVRFHARVAGNVLAIVERELNLGSAQETAHQSRLASLGFPDDVTLATAIRAGELDDRIDEVMVAVGADVLDKLAVAHPGYEDEPGLSS